MEIEKLKKSPMFNLSLSSLEPFHSNFINWLISIDKQEMSRAFSNLIGETLKIKSSEREKEKFDLWIECKDNAHVIIENKFKSLITEEQLKKYDEKLSKKDGKKHKVLLTLSNGNYEKKICGTRWKVLSYEDLCKELKNLKLKDPYCRLILKDYCSFVDQIARHFSQADYSKHLLLRMKEEYQKLKTIKLHDVQQKIWHNHLLIKIQQKFANDSDKINSWQQFSRGTGYVSFDYRIAEYSANKDEVRLELQLQYDSLKLMLASSKDPRDLPEDFKRSFFGIIEKLSESKYCRKKGEIFPKTKDKEYNKYGHRLIYKAIKLSDDLSFDEVIDLFSKVFKEVIEFGQARG